MEYKVTKYTINKIFEKSIQFGKSLHQNNDENGCIGPERGLVVGRFSVSVPLSYPPQTYQPVDGGAHGPCLPHCTVIVNRTDRNSTGNLADTSYCDGGKEWEDNCVEEFPCHMAGGIPGHLQHTPPFQNRASNH